MMFRHECRFIRDRAQRIGLLRQLYHFPGVVRVKKIRYVRYRE